MTRYLQNYQHFHQPRLDIVFTAKELIKIITVKHQHCHCGHFCLLTLAPECFSEASRGCEHGCFLTVTGTQTEEQKKWMNL